MGPNLEEPLIPIEELQRLLKTWASISASRSTLLYYRSIGMPCHVIGRRCVRFRWTEVQQWLLSQRNQPAPAPVAAPAAGPAYRRGGRVPAL